METANLPTFPRRVAKLTPYVELWQRPDGSLEQRLTIVALALASWRKDLASTLRAD